MRRHPDRVRRAIPEAWKIVEPNELVVARADAAASVHGPALTGEFAPSVRSPIASAPNATDVALAYFDASALVKLVVDEDASDLAARIWDGCDAAARASGLAVSPPPC